MVLSIITIAADLLLFAVLNIKLFTDRFTLPDEERKVIHRSSIDSLDVADKRYLLYVFLFFAVVGIVTAVLYMCGVKNNIVKVIRLISLICSAVMFIIIMIVAVTTHPSY